MDKDNMQAQELDQVSGGMFIPASRCTSCGKPIDKASTYPNGAYVKTKTSCSSYTLYYKCPYCGFEWTE